MGEIRRSAGAGAETEPPLAEGEAHASLLDTLERDLGSALYLSRSRAPSGPDPGGSTLVEHVKFMVCRDPGLPYTVSRIAKAARVTPNHFSALFTKHAGQTFVSYLREERLRLAQNLLRDLSLNIAEVAVRCGFSDPGYFTRCFRKHVGTTPGRWRKALQRRTPRRPSPAGDQLS